MEKVNGEGIGRAPPPPTANWSTMWRGGFHSLLELRIRDTSRGEKIIDQVRQAGERAGQPLSNSLVFTEPSCCDNY